MNHITNLGTSFVSIKEQFDTKTPMGRAMMYIASVFAQLEREVIAERIRDNMIELAKTGRWLGGKTPTGYKSERIINSDGSIREIVTNPKGKRSYRDISADKRDTTYTNDLSSMSRSNNPKWWKFRDKKVERQEYDKRDKAFNKRFNLK